jgi:putative addiction module antidote
MNMRKKITTSGNSAAIVIPKEVLAQMQLEIGDEIEFSLMDQTLIIRPVKEVERSEKFRSIMNDIFERRADALKRLAE